MNITIEKIIEFFGTQVALSQQSLNGFIRE